MAFIDDYKALKEKKLTPSRMRPQKVKLFNNALKNGVKHQDIVSAIMAVDGISESLAEKRVSHLIEHGNDISQKDNANRTIQNIETSVSAVMDIPLDKLVSAPKEWNFFSQPNKIQYENIVSSINTYGLFHPITVWEQDNDTYMILGGHTRLKAFKDLYEATSDAKFSTIPCNVYPKYKLDETDAKRIIILDNIAQRGSMATKDLARSYGELARLEKTRAYYGSGDINERVAKLIGKSRKTVIDYRHLNNLNDNLIDAFANKTIKLSEAVALSKLDSDLQQHIYEKDYYKQLKRIKLSNLKKASTIKELDKLFNKTDEEIDKEAVTTIKLTLTSSEADILRRILQEAVTANEELSDKTKTLFLNQF